MVYDEKKKKRVYTDIEDHQTDSFRQGFVVTCYTLTYNTRYNLSLDYSRVDSTLSSIPYHDGTYRRMSFGCEPESYFYPLNLLFHLNTKKRSHNYVKTCRRIWQRVEVGTDDGNGTTWLSHRPETFFVSRGKDFTRENGSPERSRLVSQVVPISLYRHPTNDVYRHKSGSEHRTETDGPSFPRKFFNTQS